MSVIKKYGTGLACCRICGKVIKKGEIDFEIIFNGGYNTIDRHFHLDCINKMKVKK